MTRFPTKTRSAATATFGNKSIDSRTSVSVFLIVSRGAANPSGLDGFIMYWGSWSGLGHHLLQHGWLDGDLAAEGTAVRDEEDDSEAHRGREDAKDDPVRARIVAVDHRDRDQRECSLEEQDQPLQIGRAHV